VTDARIIDRLARALQAGLPGVQSPRADEFITLVDGGYDAHLRAEGVLMFSVGETRYELTLTCPAR
jgi:hypothetical protein